MDSKQGRSGTLDRGGRGEVMPVPKANRGGTRGGRGGTISNILNHLFLQIVLPGITSEDLIQPRYRS